MSVPAHCFGFMTIRFLHSTLLALLVAACSQGTAPTQSTTSTAQGTVELNQGPPKDVLRGGSGVGTVAFQGRLVPFTIGGVGVDGAAIAILQTSGEVLHLQDLASFPGTYHRAPGNEQSADGLWLQNERGTIVHLRAPPQGRIPDIGTDAVRIVLTQ